MSFIHYRVLTATCILFVSFLAKGNELELDGLDRAQQHAVKVVESCMEYGLESSKRMMSAMQDKSSPEVRAFLENYYNRQIKMCLEIYSVKLKQAADSIN
ncbi:hypothetical protein [Vibrio vulnificus]|uniref:hypothetical protein n=1 Tax=Vibrio vulnificus TaxID=672 RepID=UPI00188BEF9B|nr:hypothetical protein [Vibrio vulnificus]MBF4453658.1 hypothetical protein [Vibrio vulnificus]MBF4499421.1 hypothetical protein [Vibrio vulnificus]MBL6179062.1 hypothetical protein [Vibrio vulnificus]HDY7983690.1 hypothetical protein [Vibrio vulnificus]HDY8007163.1 hypothetical protein [Vibrio vulnificus]